MYDTPEIAAFLNPIHADFKDAHAWECEVSGEEKTDLGLKSGYTSVTTVRRVDLPQPTTDQRVRLSILCAMEVYRDPHWVAWAQNWLNDFDKSCAAAASAAASAA